ncbi:helix-turn-helix domain-containing protein [Rossellomorea vietnamensis]|uniref:Helix-turn-helix domain-containing protein n=1 Tax=Rossellomorea vietnamensis TaxID=218284 RepID=A0A5D4KDG4_9BACI|nr:helix-turn-helix domain-containing protein [Rossellomorea vietnamensis]TYR75222.1 helix-turn-helix domain-containing protein [Rossellomorea vietnamensis]
MAKKQHSHTSVENKLEAVKKVLENHQPVAAVAKELGLHRDTVNRWVNQFKANGKEGLMNSRSITNSGTTQEIKRIRELEKKLKEKEQENEILKKFQAFLKENE